MNRYYWWGLSVFFFVVVVLLVQSVSPRTDKYLEISFLDVGQGDAILVTSPSGVRMLVDGGNGKEVLRALGHVMSYGDRDIDILVATHPDADHIGGFAEVLERYDVSYVLGTNAYSETQLFSVYEHRITEEGATRVPAVRGQVIELGAGVYVQVLFPHEGVMIDGNDASVVIKVIYGDATFFLTGDVSKGVEEYLVSIDGEDVQADVLKLGHHGSKTSTSKTFLEIVQPVFGVISAGEDNRYGHPHEEVLETLASVGLVHEGTYENGTITLQSDGKNIWKKK